MSRYGAIAKALPFTPGRILFVVNSAEAYSSDFEFEYPADSAGRVRVFSSVASAYAEAQSNRNDVIVLDGNATHNLDGMLTVSKNRVHFVGLDYLLGVKRPYGASAKIALGVTTDTADIATILNSGVRNSFIGVKVISNNTLAQSLYGLVDAGEYTYMENVEVYKSTHMDGTGAADMVMNADSPCYVNCTFGSLATPRDGAVIRAAILLTKEIGGAGKVTRDAFLKDCNIWINADNTANRFVYGANATDVERSLVLDNCLFINNGASSAIPAQNVAFGATLTVGKVLINNPASVNASTAMSTTAGVFVNGAVPAAATTGISVQAS